MRPRGKLSKLWKHDEYNLRKYSPTDIDYFLDIGACVGTASVLFKTIDPFARVIAIEPCKREYEILTEIAYPWGIDCYNLAFGNGESLCFDHRRSYGGRRFYTKAEKKWWPKEPEYFIKSLTLPDLFAKFKITDRYIIKIDAEGGERFLLNNEPAIEIIKNAVQLNIELHRGFAGTIPQWIEWFNLFKDTHELSVRNRNKFDSKNQRIYDQTDTVIDTYRREYMLVKK